MWNANNAIVMFKLQILRDKKPCKAKSDEALLDLYRDEYPDWVAEIEQTPEFAEYRQNRASKEAADLVRQYREL